MAVRPRRFPSSRPRVPADTNAPNPTPPKRAPAGPRDSPPIALSKLIERTVFPYFRISPGYRRYRRRKMQCSQPARRSMPAVIGPTAQQHRLQIKVARIFRHLTAPACTPTTDRWCPISSFRHSAIDGLVRLMSTGPEVTGPSTLAIPLNFPFLNWQPRSSIWSARARASFIGPFRKTIRSSVSQISRARKICSAGSRTSL